MAQRNSGYERQALDWYPTPSWVPAALCEVLPLHGVTVWEPAAGDSSMAEALRECGATVWESDIAPAPRREAFQGSTDFLTCGIPPQVEAIVSNPPWGAGGRLAVQFIERGLQLLREPRTKLRTVAFLLSADFDSASGRVSLFADCPEFTAKVVLLRRIRWFDGPAGPSTNHAWFAWQRPQISIAHAPVLCYAPRDETQTQVSLEDV